VPEPRNAANAARLAAFEQRMNIPILISAILPIIVSFGPDDRFFFVAVMVVTWGVFIADYVVHVRLLRGYARSGRGLFDLGVVFLTAPWFLIPGLGGSQFVALARLARLARIAKVSDGGVRRLIQQLGRVGLYTVLLVAACSYVAYEVEKPVNAEFANYGDSLFWAIVTITTVGYGNVVPVTGVGQLMAVILMFSGVALLGVLAGTLASFFGFGDNDEDMQETAQETLRESDQEHAQVPADASRQATPDPAVGSVALAAPPESSLTVPDSLDVAALRARLADLDDAVAALRSQLQ
jgi:voltage-gated potassium channel